MDYTFLSSPTSMLNFKSSIQNMVSDAKSVHSAIKNNYSMTSQGFVPNSMISNVTSDIDAVSGAAYRPNDKDRLKSAITSALGNFVSDDSPSDYGYSDSSSTPTVPTYIDAPLAQAYGMDASTAYNEALSNTAYQRKVKDLQAAGLNPVLGISGAGAANFYGSPIAQGGVGGSGGSAKSNSSEMAEKLGYWLPTLANGITNLVVWAKTGNSMSGFGAGMLAQNIMQGALSSIRNHT